MIRPPILASLALSGLCGHLGLAAAQTKPDKPARPTAEPRKWEHETSDLKPDPKINFGSFKNGFRYAWVNCSEPKKKLFLRLHLNVGSLVETEQELGMAHFVEHMAFNGTIKFKAGTLVETFNKQGVKFGHDVNAHTSTEETVYELDLPDAEPERLKMAFAWFRDVANGLKMEEKEVQSEKGVIDSEQRDRDSAGFRNFVSLMSSLLDGTLFPKRMPIGIQDVRAKFNSKLCLGFYKRWYRPEHLTFLMVGDLGTLDPTQMITEAFQSIPIPKDPLPARPDLGKPTFAKKGFAIEAGGGSGRITIARLSPLETEPDNAATRAGGVALSMAHVMAGNRLQTLKEKDKEGIPFLFVNSDQYELEQLAEGPCLQITCDSKKWRESLMVAERELRRLLETGFTDSDFKKAFVEFDSQLVPRPTFPPVSAFEYLQELMAACNGRYVPMEDKAGKEALGAGRRGLKVDVAFKAFKEAWSKGQLVIYTEGGIDLGADPAAELLEVWEAAKATKLDEPLTFKGEMAKADTTAGAGAPDPAAPDPSHPTEEGKKEADATEEKKADPKNFAYALPDVVKDPTATINRITDLGVADITFKNGVRANYKKPEVGDRAGRFFAHYEVRVGEGMLALDPSKREVAWLADNVLLPCGLAKNDWATVRAAGGGSVRFSVEGDACVFSGAIYGGELKRPFEVICAYLKDAGWRQEGFDEFKKKIPEELKEDGPENLATLQRKFERQLYADERRLLPIDQAAAEAVTFDEVRAFLKSQLDGPVSVSVVGVDAGKAETAILSTFATLPQRRAAQNYDARRTIAPPKTGIKARHEVDTGQASALVHIVYPSPDASDLAMARKLELLEDIVQDRLRIEIREKRAGAYSPRASVWGSNIWKGFGWVTLDVEVDPAKIDEMAKACALTMETLGTKGATQAELDRLRIAHLGDLDAMLKSDERWFEVLKAAIAKPQIYEEMRNLKAGFDKITLVEMNALAKSIFVKGRENTFLAVPKKP